jgi:hypothetical protein
VLRSADRGSQIAVLTSARVTDGINLHDDIDRQIKELERDKRLEEIKQLRAGARTRWITPTAFAALLPLVAGFGLWIAGELKQYNEGYRALAERDALKREKDALQQQKDSLNIEVSTLLQLKTHYAEETARLQRDTIAKQDVIDKTYLRAAFTGDEALYALGHFEGMGPPLDAGKLRQARDEVKRLTGEAAATLDEVLRRYQLSQELIGISKEVMSEFKATLKVVPASDWTRQLQSQPTGAVLPRRKIMISEKGNQRQLYDVIAGRFLTADEAAQAR